MPDDSRPHRAARPAPAPPVAEPDADAIDPELLAELRQQIKDIEEHGSQGMPLEEFLEWMNKPLSPEDLAEIEAHERDVLRIPSRVISVGEPGRPRQNSR